MKTSNKLLAAFFVIVFAVPFIMLVGFQKSIKELEPIFIDVNNQLSHKGEIKPYKFIKIIGPVIPEIFSCKIIPSDSAFYIYNTNQQKTGEDGIILEQVGDTLLVRYSGTKMQDEGRSQKNYYSIIQIDLYLPLLNKIIVEGATTVLIDSMNTANNPQISFDLRNQANLQLGNFGHSQTTFGPGNTETELDGTKDIPFDSSSFRERSGKLLSVHIKASNASFTVGPYAWINHLQLQINGQSQVSINTNSRIDQLSGFISDSSVVSANWKNIRRLAALTKK